ncbi:hypothetical protein ACLB2K_000913 [Fragaria x ananassa]
MEMILKNLDLENEIHVERFRAVSQSWRSSIPPLKPPSPPPQLLYNFKMWRRMWSGLGVKRTVLYHAVPPPPANDADERKRGWLFRLCRVPDAIPKWIPAILPPPSSRCSLTSFRFRPEDIYSLDFDSSVFASHYLKNLLSWNLIREGGSVDKMLQTGVKFKVYRLDQNSGEWIEMQASDLKRRILFEGRTSLSLFLPRLPWMPREPMAELGFHSGSVAGVDYGGGDGGGLESGGEEEKERKQEEESVKMNDTLPDSHMNGSATAGSCIYFCYEYEKCPHEICSGIGVFNLDDGMGLRLEHYPPSANILMPPPT